MTIYFIIIIQIIRLIQQHKNVVIQIGFQAYPTKIKDSNLEKINLIKKKLKNTVISFADHLDSNNSYALFLPITAYLFGAQIIEKHVALYGRKAKYDGFSSLNYEQFNQMCANFKNFKLSFKNSFQLCWTLIHLKLANLLCPK
jgi:N,N'-diacetyllegionaminate synthase